MRANLWYRYTDTMNDFRSGCGDLDAVFGTDGMASGSGPYVIVPTSALSDASFKIYLGGKIHLLSRLTPEAMDDESLSYFSLQLVKITPSETLPEASRFQRKKALIIRLAIAQKILVMSQTHLALREVEGVPLLNKSLIKDRIASAVNGLEMIFASFFYQETIPEAQISFFHQELSKIQATIMRLMGGHGFLEEGSAPWGYLSEITKLYS